VVGAGPAGSTAALALARSGHSVLLVDREEFPRDKACGDCLLSDAVECLRRFGILKDISRRSHALDRATIYSPSRYHFDVPGIYLTVRRSILDNVLSRRAAEAGAEFAVGEVTRVADSGSNPVTVEFAQNSLSLKAGYVILATGADIRLAEKSGIVTRPEASAVAVRKYVRSPYRVENMILSFDRSLIPGYAWIIPMGDDLYNIGCGVYIEKGNGSHGNPKRALAAFAASFPKARELMGRATKSTRLSGAAIRCGLSGTRPTNRGHILAAGETIGTTYPFTGEGVGKAMETGELAARAIDEALRGRTADPAGYYSSGLMSEIRPKYKGYFIAQRWLSRPRINDFVARRIQESPFLQKRLKSFVADTGDPRTVFAVSSLIRSFFQ
jgi:geranylgeranyl reductase family protein